ncbi:UPF0271 protein [Litorimonas taeanensis]|uniref:UPF0271 protein n=1 Tax=Litorimonas taeanensis TaxID=568099 RepID=A0A420WM33_9PROT|nr:5-oxoprolinase subunit PxpA [Litorimonas taeanensis]RKQ72098.1 UPF0271 protein [Litorimonas taeanensis]
MKVIDLNADVGEADNADWAQSEADILRFVSSANIACGGHAGDKETMRLTLQNAKQNNVSVGAHPAYPDRKNFGRKSLTLGKDISQADLKQSLTNQITTLMEVAAEEGVTIAYVKPHGALYNDAVKDAIKAELIASVIHALNPSLIFMGGPNSEMAQAAKAYGLEFIAEGFIDRRYTDDGHLLNRRRQGAVLATDESRIDQAVSLAVEGSVKTQSGKTLHIHPQSLCLHGDSAGAVETARKTKAALEQANISIQSFALPQFSKNLKQGSP